jgi:hypothetical protein
MDENNPLVQILKQINELSGSALEALLNGGGGAEGGDVVAPPGGLPAREVGMAPRA